MKKEDIDKESKPILSVSEGKQGSNLRASQRRRGSTVQEFHIEEDSWWRHFDYFHYPQANLGRTAHHFFHHHLHFKPIQRAATPH